MIDITINGQPERIAANATVADIVRQAGVDEDASGVAVAVNDTVVPRSRWQAQRVVAGDVVEIVRAVQGG